MLLQPYLHHPHGSPAPPSKLHAKVPRARSIKFPPTGAVVVTCSSSSYNRSSFRRHNHADYEKRSPMFSWKSVYQKIWIAVRSPEDAALGVGVGAGSATAVVLNRCEDEGKHFTKWELCMVVKELRKCKRFKEALEVYDWMSNRDHRFRLSSSDAAIQLDLMAKVFGISTAEDYFLKLSDQLKDRKVYGALLNAYVHGQMRDKAESFMDNMRDKGYTSNPLPFNVMMTLYLSLKDYDKVELLVSEMKEKNVQLDCYSYNIWLSSRGSLGSVEEMEKVLEEMKLDQTINPSWTTFSTLAALYIKMGEPTKAEDCMKEIECRIRGRDRIPYHYLMSLYGTLDNKEETYRIWNSYKAVFPTIPNLGYHAMVSSLVRLGNIEEAEEVYEEWLSVRTTFDPRIGNLVMSGYIKQGDMHKAKSIFDRMIEIGGTPNSMTWETLAELHIAERRISEALSCYEKAFSVERSKSWRPKPTNLMNFFELCREEDDSSNAEALMGLLRQSNFLDDLLYSPFGLSSSDSITLENSREGQILDIADEGELLIDQLQGSAI